MLGAGVTADWSVPLMMSQAQVTGGLFHITTKRTNGVNLLDRFSLTVTLRPALTSLFIVCVFSLLTRPSGSLCNNCFKCFDSTKQHSVVGFYFRSRCTECTQNGRYNLFRFILSFYVHISYCYCLQLT